jgi:hypothetical protein
MPDALRMSDEATRRKWAKGLQLAFHAVGGVTPIAKACGIAVATVSGWDRVPGHRVITVERISGISRETLRPDLYPAAGSERQIFVRPLRPQGRPMKSRVARVV